MDIMLAKVFEEHRWETAIENGLGKGIDKTTLRSLTSPQKRIEIYRAIRDGKYEISPPHIALIPKEGKNEFRTVYVNEAIDRILLSIITEVAFEMYPNWIHPSCKSYQKGLSCQKTVREVSELIDARQIAWKADFTKYFDTVPIKFIDECFDAMQPSAIVDVLRKYYHTDLYFDEENQLKEKYQSLKQGCAFASFLADVVMFDIDEKLSNLNGYYVRYSDDTLFVGDKAREAMDIMIMELKEFDMTLNPKKVEWISRDRWFKFLGFSIKGSMISMSKGRLKKFQKEIDSICNTKGITYKRALNKINAYLYKGNGEYSFATSILNTVNCDYDLHEMNEYVMDSLRGVMTGKKKIGGLGYVPTQSHGVISRGTGKNVTSNRNKTPKDLPNYISLYCMKEVLKTDKDVYRTLTMNM